MLTKRDFTIGFNMLLSKCRPMHCILSNLVISRHVGNFYCADLGTGRFNTILQFISIWLCAKCSKVPCTESNFDSRACHGISFNLRVTVYLPINATSKVFVLNLVNIVMGGMWFFLVQSTLHSSLCWVQSLIINSVWLLVGLPSHTSCCNNMKLVASWFFWLTLTHFVSLDALSLSSKSSEAMRAKEIYLRKL